MGRRCIAQGGGVLLPNSNPIHRDQNGRLARGPLPGSNATNSAAHTLIFGLSADPIHAGHVEMVTQSTRALERRGYHIAEVLLVPVYRRNPVGAAKERIPDTYGHRLAMCTLAANEVAEKLELPTERVRASAIEAELVRDRSIPNYTAETLAHLRARSDPGTGLIFLISSELVSGPDPQLGRWYRPDEILRLAVLAICPRPGYAPNQAFIAQLVAHGACVVMLDEVTTPAISASDIRALLRAGHSPAELGRRSMLTTAVVGYLSEHDVYGVDAPT
ncbi:MAG: nicotinate-nicotinamide nucleotide adenylyltransferase [Anaerolineae bacterium]|nr:nicotinate-nicotinamide nucleotide adenylyltransferase [Anaerolineae bacterium]